MKYSVLLNNSKEKIINKNIIFCTEMNKVNMPKYKLYFALILGVLVTYLLPFLILPISSVQSLSRVQLLRPHGLQQASLAITNSQSLLKLMSIESVMPSNHLILCRPLLPLPSIFPSIRVFSKESDKNPRSNPIHLIAMQP